MLSRTDDGKYQCHWQLGAGHECNASLSGINGLVKHTRQVHLRTEEVRCEYCGLAFSRPDARERHMQKACKERPAVMQREIRDASVNGIGDWPIVHSEEGGRD